MKHNRKSLISSIKKVNKGRGVAGSLYVVIRTLKEEREINEQGLVIEIASTYEMKDAG